MKPLVTARESQIEANRRLAHDAHGNKKGERIAHRRWKRNRNKLVRRILKQEDAGLV